MSFSPLIGINQLRKAMSYLALYAGVLAIPLLLVGMYGGLNDPWFNYLFGAHCVVLAAGVLATLLFFLRCAQKSDLSLLLTLGAAVIFTALIVVESLHPITSRDALIHHLAVPKWWLHAGKIVPILWHEWSFYPMLIDMGFLGLMKFGLDQYTALYHFCFLILLCGVVASFVLYKTQDFAAATVAFLVTYTLPVALRLASSPLVDLGLALYAALALCHVTYWVEGKHKASHLVIAGIAFGLALSCKYNGILACGVAFLLIILFAVQSRLGLGRALSAICILGLFALLTYFPWLYKNAIWTNNPFYPLFNHFFSVSDGPAISKGIAPLAQRVLLYQEDWLDLVSIPLQMLFLGKDGDPRHFDGVLSPILLLLLVPLYRARKEPWILYHFFFCGLYLVLALLMSSARVRYLAPLYGSAAILTAVGSWQVAKIRQGKYRREVLVSTLSVALLWAGWHGGLMLAESRAIPYLEGQQTKAEYLSAAIPEFPAILYVNKTVPDGVSVYLLNTGNRFYYYDKPVFSSGHFSATQLLRWTKNVSNGEFLASEFKNRGIGFLLVNTALTQRTLRDMLTADELVVWNQFQDAHLKLRYAERGFSLWEIV